MLRQVSLFEELLMNTDNSMDKDLIISLFNLVKNFYYILDIYDDCNLNIKIFNYLFVDLAKYTIDEIAEYTYVCERTVRRFKKKTENIIKFIIENHKQYRRLSKFFKMHKNT